MLNMKYIAILGGIIAVVGQFWGATYYLPLVGGVIAVAGGLIDA
jgi:hypothetical protein